MFHVSLLFSTMSWNGVVIPEAARAAPIRVKSRFAAMNDANDVMNEDVASSGTLIHPSLPVSLISSASSSYGAPYEEVPKWVAAGRSLQLASLLLLVASQSMKRIARNGVSAARNCGLKGLAGS